MGSWGRGSGDMETRGTWQGDVEMGGCGDGWHAAAGIWEAAWKWGHGGGETWGWGGHGDGGQMRTGGQRDRGDVGLCGTQGQRVRSWGDGRTEGMGAHMDGGVEMWGAHGDEGHMGTQGQRGHRERDGGCVGMRGSGGGGNRTAEWLQPPPPRQDVAFFDAHRTGQLVARLTADVQEFKSSFKLIISQVGPSTAPHPPSGPPSTSPPRHCVHPSPQGLRSSTQAAGCVLSLYLLSPRLTALLLLVLPVLVGAGTALGSVLRALSRQAQEQVMGLGGGGTCRDPPIPAVPSGAQPRPPVGTGGQSHRGGR